MKLAAVTLALLVVAMLITVEMADCVSFVLSLLDGSSTPIQISDSSFAYEGRKFAVTKMCAYWDLWAYILVLVACVIILRKPRGHTIIRGFAFLLCSLVVVQLVNVLRIATAVHLTSQGVNWEYVHDAPDIALRTIFYITFGVLILRVLFTGSSGSDLDGKATIDIRDNSARLQP